MNQSIQRLQFPHFLNHPPNRCLLDVFMILRHHTREPMGARGIHILEYFRHTSCGSTGISRRGCCSCVSCCLGGGGGRLGWRRLRLRSRVLLLLLRRQRFGRHGRGLGDRVVSFSPGLFPHGSALAVNGAARRTGAAAAAAKTAASAAAPAV